MKRILHRPSPATVISCIALFVALGGVSYGVATNSIDSREIADNTIRSKDLRDNSVYSRDLRNNDIRGIDIRNNTLQGRDVAPNTITDDQVEESKLTQVPSALSAEQLGGVPASGYAKSNQEPVHVVGATGEPQFAPGVSATGGGTLPPGFWKDTLGVVHLQGSVSGSGPAFTLPAGYRPAGTAFFTVPSGQVEIGANGVVTVSAPAAPLDGIAFRAEN